jgi:hypothetical protein
MKTPSGVASSTNTPSGESKRGKGKRLERKRKPASLGAGRYQRLIASEQTTRLTGGFDSTESLIKSISIQLKYREQCSSNKNSTEYILFLFMLG